MITNISLPILIYEERTKVKRVKRTGRRRRRKKFIGMLNIWMSWVYRSTLSLCYIVFFFSFPPPKGTRRWVWGWLPPLSRPSQTWGRRRRFISMLNIRMSRTPIEGSPVPGVLRPGEPTFWCGRVSSLELLSACIPIGDTGPSIGGFPAGQESAARAAAWRISGGMRA